MTTEWSEPNGVERAYGPLARGATGERPPLSKLELESSVQLLARARGGDDGALETLCQRYLPQMQRWAKGRLPRWARDLLNTDDLVQETMLQTLRQVDSFDPHHEQAFKAYVRKGLVNRIYDEIRRVQRRPKGDADASEREDPAPSPLEEIIGEESYRCYEHALARMRPSDRLLIRSRIEVGCSYQEIADETNRPSADAARMAVSRALVRLAREMGR